MLNRFDCNDMPGEKNIKRIYMMITEGNNRIGRCGNPFKIIYRDNHPLQNKIWNWQFGNKKRTGLLYA
jgi:hypothetical protein